MTRVLDDDDAPAQPKSRPSLNGHLSAEEYLLGCCLLDEGQTLDRAIQAGLTTADLQDQRIQTLYGSLRAMRSESIPIASDTLAEFLGPRLAEVGLPTLLHLSDPTHIGTTARVGFTIEQLLLKSARARAIQETKARLERLEDGTEIPAVITRADLDRRLNERRVGLGVIPAEPQTRLFLAGKPVATPGNLVTLISKAKTGKTATIGAVVAAIIAAHHDRSDADTFGFTAPHTKEAVILIDTEQSLFDAYTCHKRTMARALETTDPAWLLHYALVGYGVKELRESLLAILTQAKASHGGVFQVILDGVADFVNSVNDEAECNEFQTWLRALSIDHDCPIICVIHSNEAVQSGDDGRGHLGKQLTRKAESNLLLKKDGEVTTITSEKQRKAPITESDNVKFKWSDEHQRHVSTTVSRPKSSNAKKYFLEDYLSVFPQLQMGAKAFPAIHRIANAKRPISRNTFWSLVEEGTATGQVQIDRSNVNEPRYWVQS